MFAYIIRRILYIIPILFGVTLLTFVLFNVVGGNPVYQKLGKHGSEAEIKIMTKELGLDRPLFDQYLFYLKQCVTFDFGRSWSTNQKISEMVNHGIGATLSLTIPAFTISIIIAILIAIIATFLRNTIFDKILVVMCLAGLSISILAYIIFFQYYFSFKLGMFPISGYDQSWTGRWEYLVLPMIIWIIISVGNEILLYRTVILDEVFQDYVRTARAKGLSEKFVMLKHVLKNAMIPIITNIVMEIPFLYTGSLLLENFFGIPGLGGMTVQAIQNSDFPVIKAMTFIGSIIYVVFNLISDVAYALVDPRIKLE
ncbi:MAG: ABC transporter permease [Oligoflexia bacterium]|nr:ABC transporter permease [Oligoflexia bacterium]